MKSHAEVLHPARARHPIVGREVVAHHLDPEVASGLDDAADRRLVRTPHHHDLVGAGLGHHLGLEVAAVHGLQVGDDRVIRKPRPQRLDRAQAVSQEERRAGFEPVHAGRDADVRGREGLLQRCQIQRELDDRESQVVQVHALLAPQRDDGVHSRRPPGWNIARRERDQREESRDDRERHGIVWRDAVEERREEAGERQRAADADGEPRRRSPAGARPRTSASTSRRWAPSAIRMPISGVRCITVCAITPNTPIAVSSSASAANADSSHAPTRVRHIASPTRVVHGLDLGERQVRIERVHLAADGADQRRRVDGAADEQPHPRLGRLRERHVDVRRGSTSRSRGSGRSRRPRSPPPRREIRPVRPRWSCRSGPHSASRRGRPPRSPARPRGWPARSRSVKLRPRSS